MTIFVIKTRSTFENVYIVEADSLAEAKSAVMDDGNPPDFYQKHLGEVVVDTESKFSDTLRCDVIKDITGKGYF